VERIAPVAYENQCNDDDRIVHAFKHGSAAHLFEASCDKTTVPRPYGSEGWVHDDDLYPCPEQTEDGREDPPGRMKGKVLRKGMYVYWI
jgi:hypothetical protein